MQLKTHTNINRVFKFHDNTKQDYQVYYSLYSNLAIIKILKLIEQYEERMELILPKIIIAKEQLFIYIEKHPFYIWVHEESTRNANTKAIFRKLFQNENSKFGFAYFLKFFESDLNFITFE